MVSHIQSYMRRQGRMTGRQRYALAHYWSRYGISLNSMSCALKEFLQSKTPIILDIGFGMGDGLLTLAKEFPAWHFLGIDVHRPGIGALLANIHDHQLTNIHVLEGDAVRILREYIAPHTFDMIQLVCPDPWPKKKHHKRRIIQTPFIDLVTQRLKKGGALFISTDWKDYAAHIDAVLNQNINLIEHHHNQVAHALLNIPVVTKFQKRAITLGHDMFNFIRYIK
jgi:tRNA (guanine-N7-)-methyltransferase